MISGRASFAKSGTRAWGADIKAILHDPASTPAHAPERWFAFNLETAVGRPSPTGAALVAAKVKSAEGIASSAKGPTAVF